MKSSRQINFDPDDNAFLDELEEGDISWFIRKALRATPEYQDFMKEKSEQEDRAEADSFVRSRT